MSPEALLDRVARAPALALLLDYDGTLADFAPTPDVIEPDPDLIELVAAIAGEKKVSPAVVSGRRLDAVERLLPVDGLTIAGSYGVELKLASGGHLERLRREEVRPLLEGLKPRWEELLAGRTGYFLEDKGWSLALHGRHAASAEAELVLAEAQREAERLGVPPEFRLLGGERFLELAPRAANKADAVDYLLARADRPLRGVPLYLGDDDKDLEAFNAVHARGGFTLFVGSRYPEADSASDCRLATPREVRAWLRGLAARLRSRGEG